MIFSGVALKLPVFIPEFVVVLILHGLCAFYQVIHFVLCTLYIETNKMLGYGFWNDDYPKEVDHGMKN